jgi:hypothetical protein
MTAAILIGLFVLLGVGIAAGVLRGGGHRHWRDVPKPSSGTTTAKFVARLKASGIVSELTRRGYGWQGPAAVSLHETNYGRSYAARHLDNLFGVSFEDRPGHWTPKRYASLAECVRDFDRVVKLPHFDAAYSHRAEPILFVAGLDAGHYGPNQRSTWVTGVTAALRQIERLG